MEAQIKAFGKTPAFADREAHITIVRRKDSRFEIGVLPAQKNHVIISNKAATNIIAQNGRSDQRIRQNTSIRRLRSAHYEVKIPDSKSASFLQKNHVIISNKAATNIIAQNGSSDQSIRQNTSIHRLRSAHYEVKIPDSKSASFLQKNHFIMIISSESSANKIISQNGSSDQRIRRNTCIPRSTHTAAARTLSVRYSAPCPCVMLKARDHQSRCSD